MPIVERQVEPERARQLAAGAGGCREHRRQEEAVALQPDLRLQLHGIARARRPAGHEEHFPPRLPDRANRGGRSDRARTAGTSSHQFGSAGDACATAARCPAFVRSASTSSGGNAELPLGQRAERAAEIGDDAVDVNPEPEHLSAWRERWTRMAAATAASMPLAGRVSAGLPDRLDRDGDQARGGAEAHPAQVIAGRRCSARQPARHSATSADGHRDDEEQPALGGNLQVVVVGFVPEIGSVARSGTRASRWRRFPPRLPVRGKSRTMPSVSRQMATRCARPSCGSRRRATSADRDRHRRSPRASRRSRSAAVHSDERPRCAWPRRGDRNEQRRRTRAPAIADRDAPAATLTVSSSVARPSIRLRPSSACATRARQLQRARRRRRPRGATAGSRNTGTGRAGSRCRRGCD